MQNLNPKYYLIIETLNNGYPCSCCYKDWEEFEVKEFENDEQAVGYGKYVKSKKRPIKIFALVQEEPIFEC